MVLPDFYYVMKVCLWIIEFALAIKSLGCYSTLDCALGGKEDIWKVEAIMMLMNVYPNSG